MYQYCRVDIYSGDAVDQLGCQAKELTMTKLCSYALLMLHMCVFVCVCVHVSGYKEYCETSHTYGVELFFSTVAPHH